MSGCRLGYGAWFAAQVIAVKLEYGLSVDPTERDGLEALLAGGGAQLSCVDADTTLPTVVINSDARSFTDHPIQPGVTPVKAVHFMELRARIDALREVAGLRAFSWTDPLLRTRATRIRLAHLLELRKALSDADATVGRAVPGWYDASPAPASTPIRPRSVENPSVLDGR